MIRFKTGDMLAEDVDAMVNTVNCVGVMGRGVALQFKRAFPSNFNAYAELCKRGEMRPGRVFVFETGEMLRPKYIVNFPSKRHWRGKSRMEDIESGLASLVEEIQSRGICSIAIPPLGSGLGGLEWSGRADGGDRPDKRLSLVPGALDDATQFLESKVDTMARFARVADLVDGFESPFGLELLSSVHWVVSEEGAGSIDEVIDRTYAWNPRKRRFTRRQIELAFGIVSGKNWVEGVHPPESGA